MNFLSLFLLDLSLLIVSPGSLNFQNITYASDVVQNSTESDSMATVEIGNESGIYFTYPLNSVKLIMQPCDSLNSQDDWFCPEPIYSRNWRVGEWKVSEFQASFTIYFSPGPSVDPEFIFIDKNGRKIGSIPALKLRIYSDLKIYSSGHTNNMFDKKRMFTVQKDTILEIKQAFYEVGIKGTLLRDIKLFTDESFGQLQQTVYKGEEVEIMFALPAGEDEPYERKYLIRTELGILGYILIENEDTYGALMKDFYYAGD
jgi:hypothetical protein